jgi:hypothetical protein
MTDDTAIGGVVGSRHSPDHDNGIVIVTVVDIHAPERSSDFYLYQIRCTQKMETLFQADAARNGYLNIDRFVFSSGRRKSNI